jgi:gliding motility-associated-like protein
MSLLLTVFLLFLFKGLCDMKYLLLLFVFAFLLGVQGTKAQQLPPYQPEQDACNALTLCAGSFSTPFSYIGEGLVSDISSTPCFGVEGNSMWLKIVISAPGTVVFTISPVIVTDDYDFAVLDATNTPCTALTSANVIRCNFNNNSSGSNVNGQIGASATGTSNFVTAGATGNSYVAQINANAGDIYLFMINNFGTGSSFPYIPGAGFTIDFTGSTATFFDNGNPTIASVIPACDVSPLVTVQMSELIQCSTLAPDGSDFSITNGTIVSASGVTCSGLNGYTDKVLLNFAASIPPGAQTISVQTGTDGNTLLDLCDNPVLLPESEPWVVNPYVPLGYKAIDTPACREIRVVMTDKIRCDSIALDGSDFSISGPQASSVVSAYGLGCDQHNFVDTVLLILSTPLQTDGTYTLTSKIGTDGNTLMDSCGQKQTVGYTITFKINSYDHRIVAVPDTLLCRAGYINLGATTTVPTPLQNVSGCDTSTALCTGNINSGFVGQGLDTNTATNSPFYGGFNDARAQYLYRAAELKAMGLTPGNIKTLEWLVTQKLSSIPYNNFTVKIGCTILNDITGAYLTGLQTVYSANYSTVPGLNTINLTTPYNWDGTTNLVVEVCYDNTAISAHDYVAETVTPFGSTIHRSGNGLQGCAITTQGSLSIYGNYRPKLGFYICEPPAQPLNNFTWAPGTFLGDSTVQNPKVFVTGPARYIVTTIDKNYCAHRDSTTVTLSVRYPFLQPTEYTSICVGESVQLIAGGGLNYTWLAPDVTTLSCITCPDPVVTPLQTTVYEAVISDQYGCADTLQKLVNVKPLPAIEILTPNSTVKYGQSIQLVAQGASLYSWTPLSSLSDPNLPDPFATPLEPTTYYVTGLSDGGCRNIDSVHIDIDYHGHLFIPTAFSPNSDGKNDVFRVTNMTFQKLQEFRVFNRWGQEIFSTNDGNKGWDGTWKGVAQENGVYQFLIRVSYPDGLVETYKGDVTLVR